MLSYLLASCSAAVVWVVFVLKPNADRVHESTRQSKFAEVSQSELMMLILMASPVLICFTVMPWLVWPEVDGAPPIDRGTAVGPAITATLLSWWSNFKLIGLCINRGPLANQHVRSSKLLTAILLFLPFSPMTSSPNTSAVRGKGDEDKYQNGKNHTIRLGRRARSLNELIVGTVAKMSFLFVITCSLLKVHQSTSFIGRGKEEGFGIYFKQLLVSYMYGLGLFCFLGAGMDISGSIVSSVFNIDLKPNFEMPFASTSHCEFWSQRWNITTASLLKQLIYDPICEARLVRNEGSYEQQQKFKPLVKFFGIAMTFLVSGLMHDVVLFAITREKRIIWSYYFWYGAIFVLVEHTASMVMPSLTFPKWMKTLYTTMSITILGDRFFIAPVSTRGIDVAVLNELMSLFNLRI